MPSNAEAAAQLREIADLLDLLGERFKPEAYRRAARSLEGLTEELNELARRDELGEIPGVGEAIAEKLREYLAIGRIPYRDRLAAGVPPGVVALMLLPGLGPKTARRFWTELGIDGPDALGKAIDDGRLNGIRGFGERKIGSLRAALSAPRPADRMPLWEATILGREIVAALRAVAPVDRAELAGSLRRARESVGDLDVLVTSAEPPRVLDAFGALPAVGEIRLRGETKETVILRSGVQVDLRVLAPDSFGAALQYFTGSKEHNVRIRTRAQKLGLRVNEYGVYRGEERIAGATEAEVYGALGLPQIPPELREDRGEIDAALAGTLPPLIGPEAIRGDLHVHLPAGAAEVEAIRASAASLGHRYVGLVPFADASAADVDALRSAVPTETGGVRAYWGREDRLDGKEVPTWGSPPDYRLLSGEGLDEPPPNLPASEGPPCLLVHLRLDPSGVGTADATRSRAWREWARSAGVALELNPRAGRDGLDSGAAREAARSGIPIFVSGTPTGPFDGTPLGVAIALARRAGLGASAIRNSAPEPFAGPDRPATRARRAGRPGVSGRP